MWVVWCRAGTCVGLELAVEELVEALELVRGDQDLVHVELMEVDESLDLRGRRWVVVLSALLKGHGSEKFANCGRKSVFCSHSIDGHGWCENRISSTRCSPAGMMARLTLILFHAPALQALVQQTNAQSDVNAHALLIDHASDAVLNQDVGTVCTEFVAAVGNLVVELVSTRA